MSRIVFGDTGWGGSSQLAAASAIGMALTYPGRLLLLNGEPGGTGVEAGFSVQANYYAPLSPLAENGMDAIRRLAANQKLTKHNFPDYTLPVVTGRLDLLTGCSRGGPDPYIGMEEKENIYSVAEQVYDICLSRTPFSGKFGTESKELYRRGPAPLRVAVLRQDRSELEAFFLGMECEAGCSSVAEILVVYPYDPGSQWTVRNICRRFACTLPVYGISYSTKFADAWNNRELLKFFRLHCPAPQYKKVRDEMLRGLMPFCQAIYTLAGRGTPLSGEKGA
ncbi:MULTISPECIES: hypothetical protein [Paenibacillus]|uniref:hypothetical protein n=1 Tax=Paenibacillus TaxID=44249 RepID=UPI002FE1BC8A